MVYMIAFKDKVAAKEQLIKLDNCQMLAVHNDEY